MSDTVPHLTSDTYNDPEVYWEDRIMKNLLEVAEEYKEGLRYDKEKPRLDLIPPEAIMALGEVLRKGAEKYADRNWEKGMDWSRVFGPLQRHLWKWWGGENRDSETNLSHLYHALANIVFLLTYEERKIGTDDRQKTKG